MDKNIAKIKKYVTMEENQQNDSAILNGLII
jgi:hypothetical protein